MFIVLDGIDGGGKSTQIERLAQRLRDQNREVVCCADPGTTPAGLQIRQLLLNRADIQLAPLTELLLFFSARAQLIAEVIAPALAAGQVVICDRFLLSSVVYQGHLGQIPPAKIWELGRSLFQSALPDLTVILDLPVEVAAGRTQRALDRIESRGPAYLATVRESFLSEAQADPAGIKVIDATQSPDFVAAGIYELVQQAAERPKRLRNDQGQA
ncbi:MAG: dTMP kinase [Planctomycetaceae bacterium]|nr:dTMP kinase [Planctomycetaceae bacterium]